MAGKYLSKSRVLSGRQCEKRLWLEVHRPELIEYDDSTQRVFNIGHAVNDAARAQYPGGVLIEYEKGTDTALKETQRLLAEQPRNPIFEAAFKAKGVLVRTDILRKKRRHFELIEVKSSTGVKDTYLEDCAVQSWVLDNAGLPLGDTTLCHINRDFVYPGNSNYDGLFTHVPMTSEIKDLKPEVGKWVRRFRKILDEEEPRIDMGPHCHEPYDCPFINYCAGPQPEYPLDCLPGRSKAKDTLISEGIRDIRDIPPGRLTSWKQEWVREVTVAGKADLKPEAGQAVSSLPYPRYFLDFETAMFAVPVWPGTRPYDALPFQWSCHIQESPKKLRHEEFIDCTGEPPMRPLAEKLLKTLGSKGPIFIYSHYEKTTLNKLASMFPELARRISALDDRYVDLLQIARNNYYHPDMRGSWSIKDISPIISKKIDYSSLEEVQDGGAAQDAYLQMFNPALTPEEQERLRKALLEYCKLDTLAMVEMVDYFAKGKCT